MTKKVFVIGSGAREHAIVNSLLKNEDIDHIYIYPGNDGIVTSKVSLSKLSPYSKDFEDFCKTDIDLVVPGQEDELVNGIVDNITKLDIDIFGPTQEAARIEGSKEFAKRFMMMNNIPTSSYDVFTNIDNAISYVNDIGYQNCVIKASGLAGGKGVMIPESQYDAIQILKDMLIHKRFGNAGDKVIIEEKLYGTEVSVMGFCNGKDVWLMPQAQDYKRFGDDNTGLNTGGMGSHAPVFTLNTQELSQVKKHMECVVKKLNYKGVLYAGLMKTTNGLSFLEFNCRFGDPEAQVLLALLDSDLYSIMKDCIDGNNLKVKWKTGYASNVVLSHLQYPMAKSKELLEINGIDNVKDIQILYSNVSCKDNKIYTTGGRVMSLVSYSNSMYSSISKIYNNAHKIHYDLMYYRRDIGFSNIICENTNFRKHKIAILGSTNGTSSQLLMDQIKSGKLNASIGVVVTNRSDSSLLDKARERKIPAIYFPKEKNMNIKKYDNILVEIFRSFDIDFVYLVGYMNIVSNVLINEYKDKIFNIHPSLLPKYSGMMDTSVHESVIKNNEITSGCTLHFVTEEIDKGDIIIQKQCFVGSSDSKDLKLRVQELESKAIVESVKIMSSLPLCYKDSGVDVEKGDDIVNYIKNLSKSMNKCIGGFCAEFKYENITFAAATDGVGTKLDLAIKTGNYDTIGIDLVAMSVNDLLTHGVCPKFFLDYIAIDSIDDRVKDIIKGIYKGCEIAKCKLIGGETAEMPGIYRYGKFDLAGFAVGIVEDYFENSIKNGDLIYGIASNGIHSNGYTLVRKLLKDSKYDILELLKPTRIYMEVLDIIKKYKGVLSGIAHITGGGFNNVRRILPEGFDIILNDWELPDIFKWIQKRSGMSYLDMLETYNCGYGMILIFHEEIHENELDLIGKVSDLRLNDNVK